MYKICIECNKKWNVSVKDKQIYYLCPHCTDTEKKPRHSEK